MSNSNSDGSATRRQELRDSDNTSRGEEEKAVRQAEERRMAEEGRKPSALGRLLGFFYQVIRNPLMNAAVTIFSLGVGVGLILGDSFRDEELLSANDPNDAADGRSNLRLDRRRRHQIEELPDHSPAAALLPSQ